MNDLLDEFEEPSGIEMDIFVDDRDNCGRNDCSCKKKKTPHYDYAMDSTFVSMLPCEPNHDQTIEQALFDHTLDNMSMAEGGEGTLSELLRDKSPRSRFISD